MNDDVPFICEFCNKESMYLESKLFHSHDIAENIRDSHHDIIFPDEWSRLVYTAIYKCYKKDCSYQIVSSGTGFFERVPDFDVNGYQTGGITFEPVFIPEHFSPAIKFFDIPTSKKRNVESIVVKAFDLAMISPSASVNRVRTAIELLLDDHAIPRPEKGNLFSRIEDAAQNYPAFETLKNHLDALRFIGNAGSHEDSAITIDHVKDSFEILEKLLEQLYPPTKPNKLNEKIAAIVENKGPLTAEQRLKIDVS
ncbi:DUF4145 domain-containing protein [Acinetobacter higginsii]|uniref:DUF4145 domain-containing protein n=1 Tax=Acinetobacter higginsii TaxID=70347 RepID=UPI001F4BBACD|nr:DUF4145 domain-containing protein [Acinetobacter higginsii]MCH7294065.1 DUF4145 domain-containing protein [Acinetobacter higginsii]